MKTFWVTGATNFAVCDPAFLIRTRLGSSVFCSLSFFVQVPTNPLPLRQWRKTIHPRPRTWSPSSYRTPFKFLPPSGLKWKRCPWDWWHPASGSLLLMQKQVVTSRECKTIELKTFVWTWWLEGRIVLISYVCLYSHIVLDQMCVGRGRGGVGGGQKERKKSRHYKL